MKRQSQASLPANGAFSLLELLVTLVIVFLTTGAAFALLHHTTGQAQTLQERMRRQNNLHYCLNYIIQDITAALSENQNLTVQNDTYDIHDTAQLSIRNYSDTGKKNLVSQIDWISVPRIFEEDLVLFRREKKQDQEETSMYVPLCHDLHSFEIYLLNSRGEISSRDDVVLVEIIASLYVDSYHDPQHLYATRQTWCLDRTP